MDEIRNDLNLYRKFSILSQVRINYYMDIEKYIAQFKNILIKNEAI